MGASRQRIPLAFSSAATWTLPVLRAPIAALRLTMIIDSLSKVNPLDLSKEILNQLSPRNFASKSSMICFVIWLRRADDRSSTYLSRMQFIQFWQAEIRMLACLALCTHALTLCTTLIAKLRGRPPIWKPKQVQHMPKNSSTIVKHVENPGPKGTLLS